ncbi:hypothetical protein ACSQ6I_07115 [Anabaena sp. WFMT]|uniref:hypothetical protein n=1 Tax=Anabaena sp. WFMT TaxID=3449730 RepID=UPI003F26046A
MQAEHNFIKKMLNMFEYLDFRIFVQLINYETSAEIIIYDDVPQQVELFIFVPTNPLPADCLIEAAIFEAINRIDEVILEANSLK